MSVELYEALAEELEDARHAVGNLRRLARDKASAEAKYQKAKAETALKLKAEGHPATMIQMILKGDRRVNNALFARDCAEAEYEATVHELNFHKQNAKHIEAQIEREWAQAKRA